MSYRTTDTAVRGIIEGVDDLFDLNPFIETANSIVTALCLAAYTNNDAINAPKYLELIERWLAAHFYSVDHSRLLQEVIGRSREMIEGKIGMGLQLTHHGQQIMNGIDFLGTLASFGQPRKKVKVVWLGKKRPWWRCGW